mgnify:CR=1 FL=1
MKLPVNLQAIHEERLRTLRAPKHLEAFNSLQGMDPKNADSVWTSARALMPWKKGPFSFQGLELDGEWDCRQKWTRLSPHLGDLEGKRVLDLGCNNGWYMHQLRRAGAKEVIGFDPMPLNLLQWQWAQKISYDEAQEFYLLGVEDLPSLPASFDAILSFGVLYHHRSPLQQLIDLRESLTPGGTLFLETIGVPGSENTLLLPPDRYANMPNVWFLPTLSALVTMLERTRFTNIKVLSTTWGGVKEQRATEWTTGPSYQDILDPKDSTKTMEGLPAPERFMLSAARRALQ